MKTKFEITSREEKIKAIEVPIGRAFQYNADEKNGFRYVRLSSDVFFCENGTVFGVGSFFSTNSYTLLPVGTTVTITT